MTKARKLELFDELEGYLMEYIGNDIEIAETFSAIGYTDEELDELGLSLDKE